MNRFALRNLVRNRVRSFLALLGLAGSTAGVVVLVALSLGARKLAKSVSEKAPGIFVMNCESLPHFSKVSLKLEEPIGKVPGVAAVDPEIWAIAYRVENQGALLGGAALVGIDPVKHARLQSGGVYARNMFVGRMFDGKDPKAALISHRAAKYYKKELGSTIRVLDYDFTIVGIFATESPIFDGVILAPMETVRSIAELRPTAVSCFFVEAVPGEDMEQLRLRIQKILPDNVEAGSTSDWSEGGMDFVAGMDAFLGAIAAVAGAIGAVGVVNTMLMSVRERIHELGVLRATGWTRREVFRLILTESALLGAAGGALGIAIGIVAARVAEALTPLTPTTPLLLLFASLLGSVGLGALGGLYPAIAASRLEPMVAIRT